MTKRTGLLIAGCVLGAYVVVVLVNTTIGLAFG
jgi:hypothetical protein